MVLSNSDVRALFGGIDLPDDITNDDIDALITKRRAWFAATFDEEEDDDDDLDATIILKGVYIDIVNALRGINIFAASAGDTSWSDSYVKDRQHELTLLINKKLLE